MKANIPKTSLVLTQEGIEAAEKHYSAKFIGDFCIRDKEDKYWINEPYAIFYVEQPAKPEYSHYIGLIIKSDPVNGGHDLYITDGQSAFKNGIWGIIDEDGTFVYSRFRHDFRKAKNGCAVDGGNDYSRIIGNEEGLIPIIKTAKINKDHLEIVEDG